MDDIYKWTQLLFLSNENKSNNHQRKCIFYRQVSTFFIINEQRAHTHATLVSLRISWPSLSSDFTAEDTEIIRLLKCLCDVSVGFFSGSILPRGTFVRDDDKSIVLLRLLTMKEKKYHITFRSPGPCTMLTEYFLFVLYMRFIWSSSHWPHWGKWTLDLECYSKRQDCVISLNCTITETHSSPSDEIGKQTNK